MEKSKENSLEERVALLEEIHKSDILIHKLLRKYGGGFKTDRFFQGDKVTYRMFHLPSGVATEIDHKNKILGVIKIDKRPRVYD